MKKSKEFTYDDLLSDVAGLMGIQIKDRSEDEFTVEDLCSATRKPLSTLRTNLRNLVKQGAIEHTGWIRSSSGAIVKSYRRIDK